METELKKEGSAHKRAMNTRTGNKMLSTSQYSYLCGLSDVVLHGLRSCGILAAVDAAI